MAKIDIIKFGEISGARLRKNRNSFTIQPEPTSRMSKPPRTEPRPDGAPPAEVAHFVEAFLGDTGIRERLRWTLRDSLDELLDGQRTGRWCYQQLSKTEKTHLGTAIEINITKEFDLQDGRDLDWAIDGEDLDCKFSKDFGGWEIPMEMYLCEAHGEQSGTDNHAALLLWMDDDHGRWAAGLLRITDDRLAYRRDGSRAYNRDNKRRIGSTGLPIVYWLWGGIQDDLPPNQLRRLTPESRQRVFDLKKSGQQRVNALFRELPFELISRATVATVAQQDDPMKRARDARLRQHLGREGFLVLGHQEADPVVAELLGLPVPLKGEFVACRVRKSRGPDDGPRVYLDDTWWTKASHDAPAEPAPSRTTFKVSPFDLLAHGPNRPTDQPPLCGP